MAPRSLVSRQMVTLPGIHAGFLDHRRRLGRGEEFYQRSRRIGRPCILVECCGKDGCLLDIGRQWPEILDALNVDELAHLLETDLRAAARDDDAHRRIGRRDYDFAFELISDAPFLD